MVEKSTKKLAKNTRNGLIIANCEAKTVSFAGQTYPCAIGKNGYTQNKVEGDNKTPLGLFNIIELKYRADRLPKDISFPIEASIILPEQGWCDAPNDTNYNKQVKLPYPASHEKLYREDNLYNLILVVDYNISQTIKGKGSAIFIHIAKPNYTGTEGCIALKQEDLLSLISNLNSYSQISIEA